MTKVGLKLIPNADMLIFFEKVIRGGVFYISNRYSKASNKYLNSMTQNKNQTYYILKSE